MKYVIIGATGNIGSNLYRHLQDRGSVVVGTSRSGSSGGLIPFDPLTGQLERALPPGFFSSDERVSVVMAAAATNVDECERHPEATAAINFDAVVAVATQSRKLGAQCLVFSSNFVFDGKLGYYDERHPTSPINEYGRQKARLESYLNDEFAEVLVYRLDKLISTRAGESGLFEDWRAAALAGHPIRCIAGLTFAPTCLDDISRAIVIGLENELEGLYNVGSPEFFERADLVRIFLAEFGLSTEVISVPHDEFHFAAPRPLKITLDPTDFSRSTGFRFTSMREAMRTYLARLKS